MPHIDPEHLPLLALGCEQATDEERRHLDTCAGCRKELDSLSDIVTRARSVPDVEMVEPPSTVWAAIAHHVAAQRIDRDPGPDPAAAAAEPRPQPPAAGASVHPLQPAAGRRQRSRTWLSLAAAAVFGAVIGGAAVGVVADQAPAPVAQGPTPVVVTSAQLGPLADGSRSTAGSASVDLEQIGDRRLLGVSTVGLEQTDGYYEVWLIDPRTMDMISIGAIESGDQVVVLPIPATVDLDKYSVVDISDEPLNGDPTHSQVSVLRGELST